MGLFSSKTYYYAFAGSQSLFEKQPDSLNSQILQTAIGNEGTMSQAIRFVIATDQFARARAMMRYAERYEDPTRDGGYVRGFPEANLNLVIVTPDAVEAALTRAVGAWDEIIFTKIGRYDEIFFVERAMQLAYPGAPFGPFDSGPPDESVWHPGLATIQIPIVNPDTSMYYVVDNDPDITRLIPDWDFGGEDFSGGLPLDEFMGTYSVKFHYTDNLGNPAEYHAGNYDITPYLTGEWVQIRYKVGDQELHWIYEVGSGVDPDFEAYIDVQVREASFLPVAVLMHDKVWFNSNPDSELAITTNKLLKKMGTTGDQVREDFEEAEAEDPAESGEKWDFFMHFAVPIHTNVRGSIEYLWYFFQEMEDWQSFKSNEYYDYLDSAQIGGGYTKAQPTNEINITEAGISGYNVDYRWSYIHTSDPIAGFYEVLNTDPDKWGPGATRPLKEGEVTSEVIQRAAVLDSDYTTAIEEVFGPGTDIGEYSTDPDVGGYHDIVVIRRQMKAAEGAPPTGEYETLIVMGLSMQYRINTSESGDYRFRYSVPELFGDEEETAEFRIPLLWKSLKDVPTLHREEAVADGFCATVFLVERVKVRWYQRNFFKWLIVVIAIVIIALAIWYPGFWALLNSYAGAIAAFLGTASAYAVFVIYKLLLFALAAIISMASATIGQEFGSTAALIFSIIAAAAMLHAAGGFQSLANSFKTLAADFGWANAMTFIDTVTPVYNMGFSVYSARVLAGYEDELRDFLLDGKEKQQQLRDAWDSFGPTPDWIDPMDLVNMFRRIGSSETANSYLSRTLILNPGVLGYEAITEFTNIALYLPKDLNEGTVVDAIMQDFAEQRGAI